MLSNPYIKDKAITNMNSPTSQKEVRQFIGEVDYYHNMQPMRSHKLAPLNKVTFNKRKFKWTKIKQDAFDKIK